MELAGAILRAAMECAAGPPDVTTRREKLIRDAMVALPR
jgi:hypothetical protein